jgi:hypothetical protein
MLKTDERLLKEIDAFAQRTRRGSATFTIEATQSSDCRHVVVRLSFELSNGRAARVSSEQLNAIEDVLANANRVLDYESAEIDKLPASIMKVVELA